MSLFVLHFLFQDTGPQLPTNVTSNLKYGTNLLQAVGQFKGKLECKTFMSNHPGMQCDLDPALRETVINFRSSCHNCCLHECDFIT